MSSLVVLHDPQGRLDPACRWERIRRVWPAAPAREGAAGSLLMAVAGESGWHWREGLRLDFRGEPVPPGAGAPADGSLQLGLELSRSPGGGLVCRRGHLAQTGFFYRLESGCLYGASRLRDLLRMTPELPLEVDEEQVARLLHLCSPDPRRTFYRGIHRLEAGARLEAEASGCRVLWTPPAFGTGTPATVEGLAESLRAQLRPLAGTSGYMLSGGIDSCSLAALGTTPGEAVPGFHLRVGGNAEDSRHAREAAAHLGMPLVPIEVGGLDPLASLEEEVAAFAEPHFIPNQFMMQAASRAARERGLTRLVSGVDGDCTFSLGYDLVAAALKGGRPLRAVRIARQLRALDGRPRAWHLKEWALKPLLPARVVHRLSRGPEPRDWIDHGWLQSLDWEGMRLAELLERRERFGGDSHREGIFHSLNSHIFELSDALRGNGHVGWAFPYYAPEMVSIGLRLAPEMKFAEGHNRYILRKAVEPLLPPAVVWRRDKGYLGEGLTGNLHADPDLRSRWEALRPHLPGYLDPRGLEVLLEQFRKAPHPRLAEQLWPVFALGTWLRQLTTNPLHLS